MNVLHENFGVNLDEFRFEEYFSGEFSDDGLMQMLRQWLFPWLATSSKEKEHRHPLSLARIEQAIFSGIFGKIDMISGQVAIMKDEQMIHQSGKRVKSGSDLALTSWGISLTARILDMPQVAKTIRG